MTSILTSHNYIGFSLFYLRKGFSSWKKKKIFKYYCCSPRLPFYRWGCKGQERRRWSHRMSFVRALWIPSSALCLSSCIMTRQELETQVTFLGLGYFLMSKCYGVQSFIQHLCAGPRRKICEKGRPVPLSWSSQTLRSNWLCGEHWDSVWQGPYPGGLPWGSDVYANKELSKQKEQLMQMSWVEREHDMVKGLEEGQSDWNTKYMGQSGLWWGREDGEAQ